MAKAPLARMKEEFGTKSELVKKLVPLLRHDEGEAPEDFEARISKTSNRQLLRMWAAEQRVLREFGSRDKLVEAVVALRCHGKQDPNYRAKAGGWAATRLLDLHDSLKRRASA